MRLNKFRRDCFRGQLSIEDKKAFIACSDAKSFDVFDFWQQRVFHKSHLVGMWPLLAATATCKIRNPNVWKKTISNWEDRHGLAWNDIGVEYREAKLLTSH